MGRLSSYSAPAKFMHALMGILIFIVLGIGFYMGTLRDSGQMEAYISMISLHKSLGVLILFLLILRFLVLRFTHTPELPRSLTSTERFGAVLVRRLMYLCMLLIPLSGYLMSNSRGRGVAFFDITLPTLLAENHGFGNTLGWIHELSAYALLVLVFIHGLATVKHVKNFGTKFLKRMF
jgi:cytochrome b561